MGMGRYDVEALPSFCSSLILLPVTPTLSSDFVMVLLTFDTILTDPGTSELLKPDSGHVVNFCDLHDPY